MVSIYWVVFMKPPSIGRCFLKPPTKLKRMVSQNYPLGSGFTTWGVLKPYFREQFSGTNSVQGALTLWDGFILWGGFTKTLPRGWSHETNSYKGWLCGHAQYMLHSGISFYTTYVNDRYTIWATTHFRFNHNAREYHAYIVTPWPITFYHIW